MAPRNAEQFKEMRESSRRKILRTALEQFGTKGYHTTSIEAIAKAAGISKGLIYNHFKGKEQLLEAILVGSIDEMVEMFASLFEADNPRKQLKLFIDAMFDFALREQQFWRLYWSLMSQPKVPEGIQGHVAEKLRGILDSVQRVFRLTDARDAVAEAWLFAAMLDGVILYYVFDPEHCPMDGIRKVIYDRYGLV
ncbi:MAG: TetR family transcriptional regulator [Chitinivibrionales bacterium]|nr:TetR family transcriptional regulator [Chitinivibrionales bacterium]MBD3359019.1 TetR family transcriptional regulator [Chitinivibrionales bacterium]